jgi:hypothetical protein
LEKLVGHGENEEYLLYCEMSGGACRARRKISEQRMPPGCHECKGSLRDIKSFKKREREQREFKSLKGVQVFKWGSTVQRGFKSSKGVNVIKRTGSRWKTRAYFKTSIKEKRNGSCFAQT